MSLYPSLYILPNYTKRSRFVFGFAGYSTVPGTGRYYRDLFLRGHVLWGVCPASAFTITMQIHKNLLSGDRIGHLLRLKIPQKLFQLGPTGKATLCFMLFPPCIIWQNKLSCNDKPFHYMTLRKTGVSPELRYAFLFLQQCPQRLKLKTSFPHKTREVGASGKVSVSPYTINW